MPLPVPGLVPELEPLPVPVLELESLPVPELEPLHVPVPELEPLHVPRPGPEPVLRLVPGPEPEPVLRPVPLPGLEPWPLTLNQRSCSLTSTFHKQEHFFAAPESYSSSQAHRFSQSVLGSPQLDHC